MSAASGATFSPDPPEAGEKLYNTTCVAGHGGDGVSNSAKSP